MVPGNFKGKVSILVFSACASLSGCAHHLDGPEMASTSSAFI